MPIAAVADENFFLASSSRRLAFLLLVEGLLLLLFLLALPSLASREKVKWDPMVTENLNAKPRRASAWQNSMHWAFKDELDSSTAAIFVVYFWTFENKSRIKQLMSSAKPTQSLV